MTTTNPDARPTHSGAKPILRRMYCPHCAADTFWRHEPGDAPYTWTCPCGRVILQNPWVTERHPLIDEPIVLKGDDECQPEDATNVGELEPSLVPSVAVQSQREPTTIPIAPIVRTAARFAAPPVAVQASFL